MDSHDSDRLSSLERHFRPVACRSTTPWFSERRHATNSGHVKTEDRIVYRTYYQHDRDKVLYSPYFRRLRLKSQVFPEHASGSFRTRLDHTLEVAQIARHLARQLALNEDLVDAIGLSHDLGHPAFGHSGERALHNWLVTNKQPDGFKHNWHGLRVVELLDDSYPEHPGLNLTRAVRLGIVKHTSLRYKNWPDQECTCGLNTEIISDLQPQLPATDLLEIQVSTLSDDIAQVIHDLEDGVSSGLFHLEEMVRNPSRWPLVGTCLDTLQQRCVDPGWKDLSAVPLYDSKNAARLLSRLRSEMIYRLTNDIVISSREMVEAWQSRAFPGTSDAQQIALFDSFVEQQRPFPKLVQLGRLKTPFSELKGLIQSVIIHSARISRMDGKADYIIRNILDVYSTKPRQTPSAVLDAYGRLLSPRRTADELRQQSTLEQPLMDASFLRAAVDLVASMTDRSATEEYDQLYSAYPRMPA